MMEKINIKSMLLTGMILLSINLTLFAQTNSRYPIIPKPLQLTPQAGHFTFKANTKIVLGSRDPELKTSVNYLRDLIQRSTGIALPYAYSGKTNTVTFSLNHSVSNEEGYHMTITSSHINVEAKTSRGIFYAIQTLRQLMPPGVEDKIADIETIQIPNAEIIDTPRFVYRGVMLDVARHFFSIDFLKKYIDALAFYKINTFHLHLTDDQGWRIEIKKYPLLQKISAWRKETLVGYRTDTPKVFDGIPHGGYYTQTQLKDLVRYAQDRAITIIPEIDIPGHSQAVLAAYPELGCIDSTYEVSTQWGVHKDVLCPTEETFTFLQNVFTELMAIFPSKYIHIGGDEVPKDRWKASAFCQDLIKKKGLKDEEGLQSYVIRRMEKFLNAHGRYIIGWDEILQGGIAPNAVIMSWHGEKGGVEAAKDSHDVVMTPSSTLYFNWYHTPKGKAVEPLSNGGSYFLPLQKVYDYNPVPGSLSQDQSRYVWGPQGCLWTEYVQSDSRAENLSFPRVSALAEVGWTPVDHKNYKDFRDRLNGNISHLKAMHIDFSTYYQEAP